MSHVYPSPTAKGVTVKDVTHKQKKWDIGLGGKPVGDTAVSLASHVTPIIKTDDMPQAAKEALAKLREKVAMDMTDGNSAVVSEDNKLPAAFNSELNPSTPFGDAKQNGIETFASLASAVSPNTAVTMPTSASFIAPRDKQLNLAVLSAAQRAKGRGQKSVAVIPSESSEQTAVTVYTEDDAKRDAVLSAEMERFRLEKAELDAKKKAAQGLTTSLGLIGMATKHNFDKSLPVSITAAAFSHFAKVTMVPYNTQFKVTWMAPRLNPFFSGKPFGGGQQERWELVSKVEETTPRKVKITKDGKDQLVDPPVPQEETLLNIYHAHPEMVKLSSNKVRLQYTAAFLKSDLELLCPMTEGRTLNELLFDIKQPISLYQWKAHTPDGKIHHFVSVYALFSLPSMVRWEHLVGTWNGKEGHSIRDSLGKMTGTLGNYTLTVISGLSEADYRFAFELGRASAVASTATTSTNAASASK
jgi:hypothetical protein